MGEDHGAQLNDFVFAPDGFGARLISSAAPWRRRGSMFAAIRSGAGWLAIGTALASSGCSGLSLPLPGFGPADLPPAMDPRMVQASDRKNTDRPAFFVQWKPSGLAGLTRRPKIDPVTALPEYPPSAVRKEETGTTSLESCVTAEGQLVDIQLTKSSGSRVLDRRRSRGRRRRNTYRRSSTASRSRSAAISLTMSGGSRPRSSDQAGIARSASIRSAMSAGGARSKRSCFPVIG